MRKKTWFQTGHLGSARCPVKIYIMLIAFISDIHEDARMLEKALRSAHTLGAERIFCLGDITGYSPINQNFATEKNAAACIDLLREHCEISIAGNHDMFTARRLSEYPSGIRYPGNWYNLPLAEKQTLTGNKVWLYEHETDPRLSPDHIEWLRTLPEIACIDAGGMKICLTHYIYPDISGSLLMGHEPTYDALEHRELYRCDLYLSGHLHPNGCIVQGKKTANRWVNIDFGEKYSVETGDYLFAPACLRHPSDCGLLIFNYTKQTITPIRIKV